MEKAQKIFNYSEVFLGVIFAFAVGVIFTFQAMPVFDFIGSLFRGFEIQTMASFPYNHMAKIRTRPGFGDQHLFFEVDGKDVWASGAAAPGDLNEKIYWDSTGTIVTFELADKKMFVFNAESKTEVR